VKVDTSVSEAYPVTGDVVLRLQGVSKSFGSTSAVKSVSFELRAGEVLALVGENGAGKSTCVSMIAGIYPPDAGSIVLDNKPLVMDSPLDSRAAKIAIVHQHPGLFPDLSVGENIFIGQLPVGRSGRIDFDTVHADAAGLLRTLGLNVDPRSPVRNLRTGEQQLVEIARALASDARVLIMDEPTAALSAHEVAKLFKVVDRLRAHNVAMMFVGHRLEEIFAISDRITVLRDGSYVDTRPTSDLTPSSVVTLMVGRELTDLYPHTPLTPGGTIIRVANLRRAGEFDDISFEVRAGEIVGFGGLVGAGRTELARALFGVTKADSGTITLNGRPAHFNSAAEAVRNGIAYVSEDRRGQSVIGAFSILDNVSLPILERTSRIGLTSRRRELSAVKSSLDQMRLKFASYEQPIEDLSGGNQQKVVLAKWLATNPKLLILDEPTQGIDVQTKAEVHRTVSALAAQSIAIILISSDMPELLAMSDRLIVMRAGHQEAEFARNEATQEKVGAAAAGTSVTVDGGDAQPPTSTAPGLAPSGREIGRHQADPPPVPGLTSVADRKVGKSRLVQFAQSRNIGLVAVIAVVAVVATTVNSSFLTVSNLTSVFVDTSLIAIIAMGEMFVILTRNIDVSVSSIVGLSAYLSASTVAAHPGLPIFLVLILSVGVGGVCGAINGSLVAYGGIPSIVATLGTLAVLRGVTAIVAGSKQISAGQVTDNWLQLSQQRIGPVPLLVVIAAVIALIVGYVLTYSRDGRTFYAVGSNPHAAALLGMRLPRRVFAAFVISGLFSGLTGALWASNYATVDSRIASGIELNVIAAVVVGGVAILGGVGTVTGVLLGSLTLLLIQNALNLMRVNPLWLQAVYGVVIVGAILLDQIIRNRKRHETLV